MVEIRITPIEEFERFAERLYNFAPEMQTKLDFENAYNNYMEGISRNTHLKDKSWDIIRSQYNISETKNGGDEKNKTTNKKLRTVKQVKKFNAQYLARVWNPKVNHYRTVYLEGYPSKSGRTVYKDRSGKTVKVEKVKKL